MIELEILDSQGNRSRHLLGAGEYRLGKSADCDIPLTDTHVSRHHADLIVNGTQTIIRDVGSTNGIWKGGERVTGEVTVQSGDQLRMGNLTLHVNEKKAKDSVAPPVNTKQVNDNLPVNEKPAQDSAAVLAKMGMQFAPPVQSARPVALDDNEEIQTLKREVHAKVLEYLDMHKRGVIHTLSAEELRTEAIEATKAVILRDSIKLPDNVAEKELIDAVVAEAIGLGPIEPLQNDESVTEIMVNGPDSIYVERDGRIEATNYRFSSTDSLMGVIERIVTPLGRRIDEGSPMVDARLADGSRVNAIIPPLSLVGPTVTIRKFSRRRFGIDDLIAKRTLSEEMAEFLRICVEQRRNIVVSGGTGSGKTTTLNVLSNFIPETERIVTIEDAAEVQLHQEHVVSLESRPANIEGTGRVAIRDLVRNSLRMRPDRIVVGECRGGEALDMLQAMNTGHDGSLTTGHANSPRDILSRLEVMVLMAGMDLPVRAIREQIASAVDIILQQSRFSDGKRRVTSIVEVDGMEGDVILLQKIFEFRRSGRDSDGAVLGEFTGLGYAPTFYTECEAAGETLDRSIFGEAEELSKSSGDAGR